MLKSEPVSPTTDTRLAIIESAIREIPDFPKPGILFRDITTLLAKPEALRATIDMIAEHYKDMNIGYVAGLESRGFIFGSAVAERLGAGLILVRKPGKLPAAVERHEYTLEYGTDALEIHKDAFTYHKDQSNKRVLICDDLLATGGTASAASQLITKVGGDLVGAAFVIELTGLNGRAKLPEMDIYSLIKA
jgi:adenine phosphoribosyltransferase